MVPGNRGLGLRLLGRHPRIRPLQVLSGTFSIDLLPNGSRWGLKVAICDNFAPTHEHFDVGIVL